MPQRSRKAAGLSSDQCCELSNTHTHTQLLSPPLVRPPHTLNHTHTHTHSNTHISHSVMRVVIVCFPPPPPPLSPVRLKPCDRLRGWRELSVVTETSERLNCITSESTPTRQPAVSAHFISADGRRPQNSDASTLAPHQSQSRRGRVVRVFVFCGKKAPTFDPSSMLG